ncbi:hypothetical protein AB0F17_10610 [Nonomuraea sp. NPDC026600]|uniref:hypothetical protein n=1 Tax=Nonomuraea sp. NPDC026600 TaxID=3155363 RepID=UPI0033E0E87C
MRKRSLLALAALVVLTGCGDTSASARPSQTPKQDNKQRIEAVKADCMKGKGFRYTPFVREKILLGPDLEKAGTGDYAAMKAHRSKWGFNVFSNLVYRKELEADNQSGGADPNVMTKKDLSSAQQKAYSKALAACQAQAIKQITGKSVKSQQDWFEQADKLLAQRRTRELDGDAHLVELASAMADCMTGKGYQPAAKNPTSMESWGQLTFMREMHELARKEGGRDIPPYTSAGPFYQPTHLADADARRYLAKEVKMALDDLECGKDFYAAYLPKSGEVAQAAQAEFGIDPD